MKNCSEQIRDILLDIYHPKNITEGQRVKEINEIITHSENEYEKYVERRSRSSNQID